MLFIIGAGIVTGIISNYARGNECKDNNDIRILDDHPDWAIGEVEGTWGTIDDLKQKNELGAFTGYFANNLIFSFLTIRIESGCMQGHFYQEDDEDPSLIFLEEYLFIWTTTGHHSFIIMKGKLNNNENDDSVPFVLFGKNDLMYGTSYCTIFSLGQENMYVEGYFSIYG